MRRLELEPVKSVGAEREKVRQLADGRKCRAAEELHRHHAFESRQIELGVLHEAGEIGDDENHFVAETAEKHEHLAVIGIEKLNRTAAECVKALSQLQQPLHPPEKRMEILLLRL